MRTLFFFWYIDVPIEQFLVLHVVLALRDQTTWNDTAGYMKTSVSLHSYTRKSIYADAGRSWV